MLHFVLVVIKEHTFYTFVQRNFHIQIIYYTKMAIYKIAGIKLLRNRLLFEKSTNLVDQRLELVMISTCIHSISRCVSETYTKD